MDAGEGEQEVVPTGSEDGVFLVRRLCDGKFWTGDGWVVNWGDALWYMPSPADGCDRAMAEAARQSSLGFRSIPLYIPPAERRAPRPKRGSKPPK